MSVARRTERLLLLGAGGHGRVVADIASSLGWNDIAFLDDRSPQLVMNLAWSVVGPLSSLASLATDQTYIFVTIGDNQTRLSLHRKLSAEGYVAPALIHPSAVVSPHATIGNGTVVMPNAVINAGAKIGDAVIINTEASIDHDCYLADGVHVSPGAHLAGGVVVGEASWMGIGAVVREGITIGKSVVVGAGAAVISNVEDSQLVTGVPARSRSRS